jgi:alanine-glyoxylate transaminase/serine-glyoxylate transaminase/serine-pyruvate transaminase
MTRHIKLFIPGPGDVDEDVLSSMATPVLRHYGPEWMEIYTETMALLSQFFNTSNDVFIVPGAASAVMDMAIGSLVESGKKIIVGCNGFFGNRLNEIAEGYGTEIIPFTAPWGKPLDPEILRKLLTDHPDVRVVALVHHETSTTVLNPLKELAAVVRQAGRLLVADTVSSLGGVDVQMDEWGIDICATSSNKCLESLPGISFISVSPRAWQEIDRLPAMNHGWYLDLRTWRKYAAQWTSWHPTPVTMPVNLVLAVRTSLQQIMKAGLQAHYARYTRASQAIRTGLQNIGYEMLVPETCASPIATAVKIRHGIEVDELSQWLAEEHGMVIGGGLGDMHGKIFRVGHLGKAADRPYLMDFLFAMEEFLRFKGINVPVGASLVGLK